MSLTLRDQLTDFIQFKNIFSKDDPLCSISSKKCILFIEGVTKSIEILKLFQEAKNYEKETGINPLCLAQGLIKIAEVGKDEIEVPIIIQEIICDLNSEHVQISMVGSSFLNPFLVHYLRIKELKNIDTIEKFLELDILHSNINHSIEFVGNFHPHRYELIRDIEEIESASHISKNLAKLLLIDTDYEEKVLFERFDPIIEIDFDQKNTIECFKTQSLMVQGPPGTGKSQLIVNSIGLGLQNEKTVLLSSEKRASLDAVYARLKSIGLHKICLVNFSKNEQKIIIQDLKKTWEYFQAYSQFNDPEFLNLFLFEKEVDLITKHVKNNDKHIDFLIENLETSTNYSTNTYDLNTADFNEIIFSISKIDNRLFDLLSRINLINFSIQTDIAIQLKNGLALMNELEQIHEIQNIKDVELLTKRLLSLQLFTTGFYVSHGDLISKKSKILSQLMIQYIEIEKESKSWENALIHWINRPSKAELKMLKELFDKNGFIAKYKFKKTWKKWVRSVDLPVLNCLNELEQYYIFEEKNSNLIHELTKYDIDSFNTLKSLTQLSKQHNHSDWKWFKTLNPLQVDQLKKSHFKIQKLKTIFHDFFSFRNDDNIKNKLERMLLVTAELEDQIKKALKLPKEILNELMTTSSLESLFDSIYLSAWKKNTENSIFPSKIIREKWLDAALKFEKNKKMSYSVASQRILDNIFSTFSNYHKLINSPNKKLSENEKLFRNNLKSGKNILVKEFSKKKNFRSLRSLYESDAKHWLLILKPILMMHPQRITSYFPPEPGLFDIGIIDEASQMPFSHSIGTLQRTKRIMIAGDDQQMEPSSFFKLNQENDHSVFHQAKFHFLNSQLTHHYRSESKVLIEFSNRYFYSNQLRCISNAKNYQSNCLEHHYIDNGIYDNGINKKEALEVSIFIKSCLNTSGKIGVVAFSEQQLDCIKNSVSRDLSMDLTQLEEDEILIFKTLDQVQGDEFDTLIISFGYGRNTNGQFEMRFGPLNQSGGVKRLNVLFSRSRKQIHFFSSVKIQDFNDAKNESVVMLKNWFLFIQEPKSIINENFNVDIFSILKQARNASDFTHLVNLYKSRGWKISP